MKVQKIIEFHSSLIFLLYFHPDSCKWYFNIIILIFQPLQLGKTVEVDYQGDVSDTLFDILGGIRSGKSISSQKYPSVCENVIKIRLFSMSFFSLYICWSGQVKGNVKADYIYSCEPTIEWNLWSTCWRIR